MVRRHVLRQLRHVTSVAELSRAMAWQPHDPSQIYPPVLMYPTKATHSFGLIRFVNRGVNSQASTGEFEVVKGWQGPLLSRPGWCRGMVTGVLRVAEDFQGLNADFGGR